MSDGGALWGALQKYSDVLRCTQSTVFSPIGIRGVLLLTGDELTLEFFTALYQMRENGAGLDVHVLMGSGFQDKPHYNQVSTE